MVFEQILEKILDYKGNRYELARACMEYAKCVRYLNRDEESRLGHKKEVLLAIEDVVKSNIKYTSDKFQIEIHQDEVEFMRNFKDIEEKKSTDAQSETDETSSTTSVLEGSDNTAEEDQPYRGNLEPQSPPANQNEAEDDKEA